jgi:hypothetical protein
VVLSVLGQTGPGAARLDRFGGVCAAAALTVLGVVLAVGAVWTCLGE